MARTVKVNDSNQFQGRRNYYAVMNIQRNSNFVMCDREGTTVVGNEKAFGFMPVFEHYKDAVEYAKGNLELIIILTTY